MSIVVPDHPLRLLHAPSHGPSLDHQAIRYALSARISACVVNWSEAYRQAHYLRGRPAWRVTMASAQDGDSFDVLRGKHDCPVMVRRHHDLVEEWHVKASAGSSPRKIAPPRWFNAQAFDHQLGVVESASAHPHAAVRGLDPRKVDRVAKYVESMAVLEARLARALDEDRLVIGSGDLNHPNDPDGPTWAPRAMFRRLGLRYWCVGIDYVWWHPRLILVQQRTISTQRNRQDHPWLVAAWTGFSR